MGATGILLMPQTGFVFCPRPVEMSNNAILTLASTAKKSAQENKEVYKSVIKNIKIHVLSYLHITIHYSKIETKC